MPQVTLKPPQHESQPLNTGNSAEMGDNAKTIVDAINQMFAELYGILTNITKLQQFTVANVPDAVAAGEGALVYVSDGAAGEPIVAFSNGATWLRCDTAAEISAA